MRPVRPAEADQLELVQPSQQRAGLTSSLDGKFERQTIVDERNSANLAQREVRERRGPVNRDDLRRRDSD